MSHTAGHGPFARENPNAWRNSDTKDLPPGWIDDNVRRLLEEWNRQMIKLENASKKASDSEDKPKLREQNGRALTVLRRELKEILSMEDDRAVKRAARGTQGEHNSVAALERRLDQLLERERAAQGVVGPGAGRSGETG